MVPSTQPLIDVLIPLKGLCILGYRESGQGFMALYADLNSAAALYSCRIYVEALFFNVFTEN